MSQIKGPALFLAQFVQDVPPYNTLENITAWAKEQGFLGVQIPASDGRMIDLDQAAESKQYCEDLKGRCNGLVITELTAHLLGQLVAVHPAYDVLFDAFAPESLHTNPKARTQWAMREIIKVIKASRHLGLSAVPLFSGALLWHTMYPWPQRPQGLEGSSRSLPQHW